MVKSIIYMLAAMFLGNFSKILPNPVSRRLLSWSLGLLYRVSREGPNGVDDGVQMYITANSKVFAGGLVSMLKRSKPGSHEENVALYFVELVRGDGSIDIELVNYASTHPDQKVRDFISKIVLSSSSVVSRSC